MVLPWVSNGLTSLLAVVRLNDLRSGTDPLSKICKGKGEIEVTKKEHSTETKEGI